MSDNGLPAILVSGGKGGVGKSSVAAGIARLIQRRGKAVGLLDADLSGPSQALLFSCSEMGADERGIRPAHSTDGVRVVSSALLARESSALVWSEATAVAAIATLTSSGVWRDIDLLVVDLPPGHGGITVEVARRLPGARAVLVTTGSPLALEECVRAATFLQRMEVGLVGLIENMAQFYCGECQSYREVFEKDSVATAAAKLDAAVLGRIHFGADIAHGEGLDDAVTACIGQTTT